MGQAKNKYKLLAEREIFIRSIPVRLYKSIVNILATPFVIFVIFPVYVAFKKNDFIWRIE